MGIPAPTQRQFTGWDRPVLEVAVEWACQGWSQGPLDLSDLLVVVPTSQSARRLREALAIRAAAAGTGVLSPTVVTPEVLLTWTPIPGAVASALEALALWHQILLATDLSDYPDLFPATAPQPVQDAEWALSAAQRLTEVRTLLGEQGLTIAEAADRLHAATRESDAGEPGRWQDLSRLEARYLERLGHLGLRDANRARREAATAAGLPEGIRRVAMIAVPDPQPLAVEFLARVAERLPVTVLVHAPLERAADFDDWGRPGPAWQPATCQIPIPDADIHLVTRPQDQARTAVELLRQNPEAAIGVADSDVMPQVELLLRESGVPAYDPGGMPLRQTALFEGLALLTDLASEDRFETAARLLRLPDVLAYLAAQVPAVRPAELLSAMDRLQNDHLPTSLSAAIDWAADATEDASLAAAAAAGRALRDLAAPLAAPGADGAAALGLLQRLYAARPLDPGAPRDRLFAEAAGALAEAIAQLDRPALQAACPELGARLRLLLTPLGGLRVGPTATEGMELDGWLELHWNAAPVLIITGVNEGRVPESVVGHAFLPDAARRALGLLHNDRRLTRDAYLLSALLASRHAPGGVHLVLGKVSTAGDALRPSRLLLRCSDQDLPGRAQRLFSALAPEGAFLPWQRAWTLRPPPQPPPNRVAVTSFRDYLACPFRFYLRHVLRMESLDDRKSELDALDFGTLCHAALETLARDRRRRDGDDPDHLGRFLAEQAQRTAEERYGTDLPAAVIVQLESACQRLRAAARVQALQRQAGWRIVSGEQPLGGGKGVLFHGLRVRGTVDRIDRHEDGRLRILDYKTSEKATPPDRQHLGPAAASDALEEDPLHAICEVNGKRRRWQDLQLPLYRLLLDDVGGPVAECGYFALPKAVSETAVLVWEDLTPDLLTAAERCAAACAEAIQAGRFWPPTEKPTYDDFARLFYGGAADSIAPDCVPFLRGQPGMPGLQ